MWNGINFRREKILILFARNHGSNDVMQFLKTNAKDFIFFKTNLLIEEVKGDPVKKAMLIRDVVESIAKIPDLIFQSTYIKAM